MLLSAFFAAAATIIPIDENRPMIDLNMANLLEAVASRNPSALSNLTQKVHNAPTAKSADFHSFVVENGRIDAYMWPRKCVLLPQLRAKSPVIFMEPIHEGMYAAGPNGVVAPNGGRCLLSLTIVANNEIRRRFRTDASFISERILVDLLSEDSSVRIATRKQLTQVSWKAPRTGYPVAWILPETYSTNIQFERSKKCLKRDWLSALGYTFEGGEWMPTMAVAKGTERPLLMVAFDPQRPQCISAVITQ